MNNYKLILLKDGRNILVSDEKIKPKDKYYSNFHKSILECINDNHSKGLNLLNENKFGTLTEKDFNYKIIAGIESLPTLTYSDEVKQILRDKYGYFTNDYIQQLAVEFEKKNGNAYNQEFEFYETGFKAHQSITNKRFSLEEAEIIFQAGRDYQLAQYDLDDSIQDPELTKRVRESVMNATQFIQSLQQPIELNVEVEMMLQVRHGLDWHDLPNQTSGRDIDGIYQHVPKITSNSIHILKILE